MRVIRWDFMAFKPKDSLYMYTILMATLVDGIRHQSHIEFTTGTLGMHYEEFVGNDEHVFCCQRIPAMINTLTLALGASSALEMPHIEMPHIEMPATISLT